jgi:hypothetical protein
MRTDAPPLSASASLSRVDPARVRAAEARMEAWFTTLTPEERALFDELGALAQEAQRRAHDDDPVGR